MIGQCKNQAIWWMQGTDFYDYDLACGEHVEFMRWDTHFDTYPYSPDDDQPIFCCWITHASDCAIYNQPVYDNSPCNCGALEK